MSRIVERSRLAQPNDRVFRCDIGRHAGVGDDACHPGRIHDHAAPSLNHLRELVLHTKEHAGDIDTDDTMPILFGLLGQGRCWRQDHGIVEGHIQRAEFRHGAINQSLDLGAVVELTHFRGRVLV
ncbi:MAG: hypothetical protein PHN28_11765 [Aquabacterium sp.]|nr:hypothetical protein [Aquabacterium sp.]MDD2977421.1 hypothetical protein [Aquabacterium sp.]